MELQEAKEWILNEADKRDACNSEKGRIERSETFEDICQVVKDNIGWVTENGLFSDVKIDDIIPIEYLLKSGIVSGNENVGFWNTGHWNTGDRNTGDRNTGDRNTGDRNTGDWNTGHWNTGDWNTGHRNTGDWNTGHWNTGDRNTGRWNTGRWNTGDRNTGHWNTGHRNTGDWNTGHWNTGLFNRDTPRLRIFEQDSNWTIDDWKSSESYRVSLKLILTEWVPVSEMSDQEKIDHPQFYTQDGYLKKYDFKEACGLWWGKLSRAEKDSFKSIPNFNIDIFEEITGVKFGD